MSDWITPNQRLGARQTAPMAARFSRIPQVPRFLREAVVVPFEGGVVIDGTSESRVLHGDPWKKLLPDLLPLMDGTRTSTSILEEVRSFPAEHIRDAIHTLFALGLVEEVLPGGDDSAANPETVAFFRRQFTGSSAGKSVVAACRQLAAAQVVIVSGDNTGQIGEFLEAQLEASGISRIDVISPATFASSPPALPSASSLVVSICAGEEDAAWHTHLDEHRCAHGISWLRLVARAPGAEIGPLFAKDAALRYEAFAQTHLTASGAERGGPLPPAHSPLQPAQSMLIAGLAATEIHYILSGKGPLVTAACCCRYNFENWMCERFTWPGIPEQISASSPADSGEAVISRLPDTPLLPTSYVYEEYVGATAPGEQSYVNQPPSRWSREATQLPGGLQYGRQYALPSDWSRLQADAPVHQEPAPRRVLSLADLGTVLLAVTGLRKDASAPVQPDRWAATAGNLGSVEVFVAVLDVAGLPASVYLYQPSTHSLISFDRPLPAADLPSFLREATALPEASGLAAVLIFVGGFYRLAPKYGAFGYKLMQLDAGYALAQALWILEALQLPCRRVDRWSDRTIQAYLRLEPVQEQCTAMVTIHAQAPLDQPRRAGWQPREQDDLHQPAQSFPPASFRHMTTDAVLARLYAESRNQVSLHDEHARSRGTPLLPKYDPQNAAKALPAARLPACPPYDVLRRRRSVRTYQPRPVPLETVSTVLRSAWDDDALCWEDEASHAPLTFVLLVQRVESLAPGWYTYRPALHELERIDPATTLAAGKALAAGPPKFFVQPGYASAPLFVWILGDLAGAHARHGAFGHRLLLLRAGFAAHRLWNAAIALGVGGCIVAGLVPAEARRYMGADGFHQLSLVGLAAGFPARES